MTNIKHEAFFEDKCICILLEIIGVMVLFLNVQLAQTSDSMALHMQNVQMEIEMKCQTAKLASLTALTFV